MSIFPAWIHFTCTCPTRRFIPAEFFIHWRPPSPPLLSFLSIVNLLFDACCPSKSAPRSLSLSLYGPAVIFANELLCCCHGNRPRSVKQEWHPWHQPIKQATRADDPRCIMQCRNPSSAPPNHHPAVSGCLSLSLSLQPPPPSFPSHPLQLV